MSNHLGCSLYSNICNSICRGLLLYVLCPRSNFSYQEFPSYPISSHNEIMPLWHGQYHDLPRWYHVCHPDIPSSSWLPQYMSISWEIALMWDYLTGAARSWLQIFPDDDSVALQILINVENCCVVEQTWVVSCSSLTWKVNNGAIIFAELLDTAS